MKPLYCRTLSHKITNNRHRRIHGTLSQNLLRILGVCNVVLLSQDLLPDLSRVSVRNGPLFSMCQRSVTMVIWVGTPVPLLKAIQKDHLSAVAIEERV